ncbi:glycoside hydrolase family 16 protein [uncultured Polaribacter sp.]|uniref:glycoside hydrolase family 16 protein n=1 Tax=uncultured Polaribacter sp. TaxID=174711 RepID=UPI0030D73A10
MKNIKNIYIVLFSMTIAFLGCQEKEYEFGDIIAPSSIVINAEIIGQDVNDPDLANGDGSGIVNFTVSADNASSYVYYFNGVASASPSGIFSKRFSKVGTNIYTVVVKANGTAGVSTTKSMDIEVYSSFTDIEAENFLSGANIGDSKKWYWQADVDVHVGLGPVTEDYGGGEFAYEAWWNGIKAWDSEKACMYDNEFVFTRTADGITFEQTVGPSFVPGTYAGSLGVAGDICHDETVATSMFGLKQVSFGPSTSKAAIEGSYDNEDYRRTSFEISDNGFMGWLVGSSTYDIISISNDELFVRIIEAGDGFAWYHRFTSTKPSQDASYAYNDLVWEDDFNTDGAPDATNWTYDLGDGGWGNGEVQTYTNSAENAKVLDGSLIITAKADGSGGYTSARLKSQGLRKFTYGRIEVRAKLPASAGTWPAIWMLGSNFTTVGWPTCGEIDIMEQTGANKDITLGTLHWYNTTANGNASYGETTAVADASSDFHLYTVEWSDTSIKIYLDDVNFFQMANDSTLPFNADFFMILNIAMGGTLGGDIDPSFTEDTMEIDYVKVFQ